MAKTSASWKPGQSGNPSGRPKRYPEFTEEMRSASPEAARKLLDAAAEGKPWAIQLVLAYAWGRPHDAKVDLADYNTAQLVAELRARLGSEGGSPPGPPRSDGADQTTH